MKCHVCGFCDPEALDNSPSPRFVEVSLSGGGVFKKQEYSEAAGGPPITFAAGWWAQGRADVFACPECGTLK